MMYFQVNVVFEDINEKGKIVKTRRQYLTVADNCTEAENKVEKFIQDEEENLNFTIPQVKETKIASVIE